MIHILTTFKNSMQETHRIANVPKVTKTAVKKDQVEIANKKRRKHPCNSNGFVFSLHLQHRSLEPYRLLVYIRCVMEFFLYQLIDLGDCFVQIKICMHFLFDKCKIFLIFNSSSYERKCKHT